MQGFEKLEDDRKCLSFEQQLGAFAQYDILDRFVITVLLFATR